ncbi:MAG: bacillithiol biosynthesis cysteine-adding enzyme BshC [Gemmatimonadales bacterium]
MLRIVSHPLGPLPPVAPRAAAWRPELDAAIIATRSSSNVLQRLHQPGALVVTTGQQPGLFTGPLYTVHKALAAAALARVLEARWHRPVVPVFWLAGDDHDFGEASTAAWIDASGTVIDWNLPAHLPSAPQLPMSAEHLPAEVIDGLALLERSLPAGEPREATLGWLRRHYQPGVTLHTAFSGAIAELVAPFGVVCFDPTHIVAKRAQVPMLAAALHQAAKLDHALAALPDAGTGIRVGDGATLVFITTQAGRDRLLADGQGFRSRRAGDRFDGRQIEQLLERHPERFSANVLLRPVVESALLPTVAYLAGPGELRYLERQASVLYPLLEVTPQTPVPRWSGTVVERWTERLLARLHLDVDAVLHDDGSLARAVLERDFPDDARQAIDALRHQIARSGSVIAASGHRIDPVLDRAVRGRTQRLDQVAQDIERVFLRHLRQRDSIAHAQFVRLATGLRPHGKPQERTLTAASFLGRYGDAWLHCVFESVSAWAEGVPRDTP